MNKTLAGRSGTGVRAEAITVAPASRSLLTMPAPMPRVPPVTRARLPFSSLGSVANGEEDEELFTMRSIIGLLDRTVKYSYSRTIGERDGTTSEVRRARGAGGSAGPVLGEGVRGDVGR